MADEVQNCSNTLVLVRHTSYAIVSGIVFTQPSLYGENGSQKGTAFKRWNTNKRDFTIFVYTYNTADRWIIQNPLTK